MWVDNDGMDVLEGTVSAEGTKDARGRKGGW